MARYLIVAHQTAESDELRGTARGLTERDPDAEFTLLVPAMPVNRLLLWEEGETARVADRRAASAHARLIADGVRVTAARVGDGEPHTAVADELRRQPDYAGILVCTLPARVSSWLKLDLVTRVRQLARCACPLVIAM